MVEPVEVVGTYIDQAGKEATNTQYVTAGLTIAQMIEGIQSLAQLVDSIVLAVVKGFEFAISIDLSGLVGNTAAATSDVQDVGEFVFATAANRPVLLNVPGINDTVSIPGSDNIDQTNGAVAALITTMEDGIVTTGGTIIPCDVDENDIVELVTARERVRNTGKRR